MEKVKQRLVRAVTALEEAGIDYAVAGGNAVAAWVARIDESAVRNTQDVDILLRRADLDRAKTVMAAAGFIYRHAASLDMFLDGPEARAREAVPVIFAGEKVKPDYSTATPELDEVKSDGDFCVVALEALVRMKLTSYGRKDQVHLLDLAEVGLIDMTWCEKFIPSLAERLRELLENPD
ncbi:MAG: hypothetical protein AB7J86_28950 [Vulcanimicrobiota bacterium]